MRIVFLPFARYSRYSRGALAVEMRVGEGSLMVMDSVVGTAEATGDAGRALSQGVLLGRSLNLTPDPPARDLLDGPLVVAKLPDVILPQKKLVDHLIGWTLGFGAPSRAEEHRLLWQLRNTIAAVMASVSGEAATRLQAEGWLRSRDRHGQKRVRLTHPNDVRPAFEALVASSENLGSDRRTLEVLLAVILRRYVREISLVINAKFSFGSEVRDHSVRAYQIERELAKISDSHERLSALQSAYNSYYHARQYYIYALIMREKPESVGKLFSMYCRSVFFMSRLGWDGTLAEAINRRRLPLRREVMFLIKRDRALQQRYTADMDFATEIKNIINFFPAR